MLTDLKISQSISGCVKEFMDVNNVNLDSVSVTLLEEKIFVGGKEYTVELSERRRVLSGVPRPLSEDDVACAVTVVTKLLALMKFPSFNIEKTFEGNLLVLRVSTPDRDGLLIGKNGQNIAALQHLLSCILDKALKRSAPVVVDVGNHREKRVSQLKNLARKSIEWAVSANAEVITGYLPSYERRILHEEVAALGNVKSFSVGKGAYKKVVITPLL